MDIFGFSFYKENEKDRKILEWERSIKMTFTFLLKWQFLFGKKDIFGIQFLMARNMFNNKKLVVKYFLNNIVGLFVDQKNLKKFKKCHF